MENKAFKNKVIEIIRGVEFGDYPAERAAEAINSLYVSEFKKRLGEVIK